MSRPDSVPLKARLTKKLVDGIPLPESGRYEIQDEHVDGLYLRVSDSGVKSFVSIRWCKAVGKSVRVTHGKYPAMTIEQARIQARDINEQIAAGKNPIEAKQALRGDLRFSELFDMYMSRWVVPRLKSAHEYQGIFDRHIAKSLGGKRLMQIDRKTVANLHGRIGEKHPRTANKVLALISAVFNKGISWGHAKDNPAKGVEKFPEVERERFIRKDELGVFLESLYSLESETARDFFLMCLLTGARRSNVLAMSWHDISCPAQTWQIPMTKNGTSQTVPLSTEAMAILQSRLQKNPDPRWVFPSATSKTGHLVEPKKSWYAVLKKAGLENLTIHDLRRTFGSYLAMENVSLAIIGKALNHKSGESTKVYARMDLEPVRKSSGLVGRIVGQAMNSAMAAPPVTEPADF